MNYELVKEDEYLIIKITGSPFVNERLVSHKSLLQHLTADTRKVIVDLEGLEEGQPLFSLGGILNTLKKEVQLQGGGMKLCSLRPKIGRYFQERSLDRIFNIQYSIEEAKKSFEDEKDD